MFPGVTIEQIAAVWEVPVAEAQAEIDRLNHEIAGTRRLFGVGRGVWSRGIITTGIARWRFEWVVFEWMDTIEAALRASGVEWRED
jgi:hypothetical protein